MQELINVVNWLLVVGLIASIFFIFDHMYNKNRKAIMYTLLFPPYIVYYIAKNFDETRNAFYLSLIFLGTIAYVGVIGSKPFAKESLEIILNIFFWHFYLAKRLYIFIKLQQL